MHEPLVVCMRDARLAQHEEVPPAALNGMLGIFSDPRHHPKAHERLLEMLDEQGIEPKFTNPTFNSEHVQWMVRTRLCLALISASEVVQEGLTTRPIQGVRWTIDSALVSLSNSLIEALPVTSLSHIPKREPQVSQSCTNAVPLRYFDAPFASNQIGIFIDPLVIRARPRASEKLSKIGMRVLISRVGNGVENDVENTHIPFIFIVRESLGRNQEI